MCTHIITRTHTHTHTHTHTLTQRYITHYHSWKTTADFVVTMTHEGHEGEGYWKWFDLQVYKVAQCVIINIVCCLLFVYLFVDNMPYEIHSISLPKMLSNMKCSYFHTYFFIGFSYGFHMNSNMKILQFT